MEEKVDLTIKVTFCDLWCHTKFVINKVLLALDFKLKIYHRKGAFQVK